MKYVYQTTGTCSKQILLDIDEKNNKINNIEFIGGCPGNTFGIATLVKDKDIDEVITKLEGIKCGVKPTSCPDQLATALRQIKNHE